jgi:hypothetical protein
MSDLGGLMERRAGSRSYSLGRAYPAEEGALRKHIKSALAILIAGVALYLVVYPSTRATIIVGGIVAALALFAFRQQQRLVYGLLELTFAVFFLLDASSKGRGDFSLDFNNDFATFKLQVVLLQTFGAIYVIIRGLDNCYPPSPPHHAAL